MAYFIDLRDEDRAFLDNLPLSRNAHDVLNDFIFAVLPNVDDSFRNDPDNRPYPGQAYFQMDMVMRDFWGDRRLHRFRFVVNDSHAQAGALLVVFVDHE